MEKADIKKIQGYTALFILVGMLFIIFSPVFGVELYWTTIFALVAFFTLVAVLVQSLDA